MKLTIRIFCNESGTYTGICPALPGCVCNGRDPEEAREKLDEAIRGYFAAVNNFVPERWSAELVEAV